MAEVNVMKKWYSSYTITPAAIVLLSIFVVGAVLAFVGPEPTNIAGFVVAAIVVVIPVAGRISAGRGVALKTLRERQEEFRPKHRDIGDDRVDPSVEAEAWALEQQRYRERS